MAQHTAILMQFPYTGEEGWNWGCKKEIPTTGVLSNSAAAPSTPCWLGDISAAAELEVPLIYGTSSLLEGADGRGQGAMDYSSNQAAVLPVERSLSLEGRPLSLLPVRISVPSQVTTPQHSAENLGLRVMMSALNLTLSVVIFWRVLYSSVKKSPMTIPSQDPKKWCLVQTWATVQDGHFSTSLALSMWLSLIEVNGNYAQA